MQRPTLVCGTVGILILAALLAVLLALPASVRADGEEASAQLIYFVRHAEKQSTGPDPGLTPEGIERAHRLALLLEDAGIESILTTDYRRTRETARPLAEKTGIEPAFYDPRDLPAVAGKLRATGKRTLVVGHSNTTPELVRLLGGEPGSPIDELLEHDRLYLVVLVPGGGVETTLLRYGGPVSATP